MKIPRKIGILGGMGPAATVLLMQRIIKATPAGGDADHIPMIVDNNPAIPSRIKAMIHGGPSPAPILAAMAAALEQQGAKALAMPCNSAHHYAPAILTAITIPLLNMLTLTAEVLTSMVGVGGRVGILASPQALQMRLFDQALTAVGLVAVQPVEPTNLLRVVESIKKDGPTDEASQRFATVAHELEQLGVDCNLIGCSEFSLIQTAAKTNIPLIDTLDVLTDAVIAFSLATEKTETTHTHP